LFVFSSWPVDGPSGLSSLFWGGLGLLETAIIHLRSTSSIFEINHHINVVKHFGVFCIRPDQQMMGRSW